MSNSSITYWNKGDFPKIIHLCSPSNTVAEISTECATIHVNVKDVWSNTTVSSTASDTSNTSVLMNLESSNTGYQGKFFTDQFLKSIKRFNASSFGFPTIWIFFQTSHVNRGL